MARDWNEREHPRNPEDGKFVDRVGSGGWARRISDSIGQGRGEHPQIANNRRMMNQIYDQLGIEERGSIDEYLGSLNPDEAEGMSEDDVDYALVGHVATLETPEQYRDLIGRIGTGYPLTRSAIEDDLTVRFGGHDAPVPTEMGSVVDLGPLQEHWDEHEELEGLEFYDHHLGAWRSGDYAIMDDGKLYLEGPEGQESTEISGGVDMRRVIPGDEKELPRIGSHRPSPEMEYWDEEGGLWVPGSNVDVDDGTWIVGSTSYGFDHTGLAYRRLIPAPERD